jgi:hypothetical protein
LQRQIIHEASADDSSAKVARMAVSAAFWAWRSTMAKIEEQRRKLQEERQRALGFAASPVLPGEDRAEFDQFLEKLRDEYEPEGVAQEDAVLTMAKAMWRKQRLEIFQRAAGARMRFGGYFRYPGDQAGLIAIMRETMQALGADMQRILQQHQDNEQAGTAATPDAGCAKQKSDKPGAQNAENWGPFADFVALTKLGPVLQDLYPTYEQEVSPPAKTSIAMGEYIWDQIKLAMAGDLISPESYHEELRIIEHLNRIIERSYNWLMQLKRDAKANTAPPKRVSPLTPSWASRRR